MKKKQTEVHQNQKVQATKEKNAAFLRAKKIKDAKTKQAARQSVVDKKEKQKDKINNIKKTDKALIKSAKGDKVELAKVQNNTAKAGGDKCKEDTSV